MRAASSLWKLVGDRHGLEKRDGLWSHPDLMPTAEDLDEPLDFADRLSEPTALDADLDPMAELERTEKAEREAREAKSEAESDEAPKDEGNSPS